MSNGTHIEYRTAESVSPHHPDKLCDQISDAILDACLEQDPNSRVAIESMGGHGIVTITGELTTTANINIREIAQRVTDYKYGVQVNVVHQSPEIAAGVDTGGAGDQGIMIGYACDETPELLPMEVVLSRRLNQYIYKQYRFDGKTQVTLKNGQIETVVASFQNVEHDDLENNVRAWLGEQQYAPMMDEVKIFVNPAGDWVQGGFEADTGLTGRKLAVDNYGPRIAVGGGAFSGKDASKVDRSAAYMARRVAVDYLRERKAKEVFVRLAYAIGVAEPLEKTVIIDGAHEEISDKYDLTPRGIIATLDLKRPIYEPTARYGHFGEGFDWDK
ncbi:methionine adenosyltransferase domain-containing protein [Candidatus Saccharibacteria bacterium]|nr:methionine adenosyltransferase domain-containing protein [Candidatus Saccharibacteria bacterium]MCL1963183.1 methionine adenosyltransferase domain-containing protein [Candidatus Saccharibacteria bacterium]